MTLLLAILLIALLFGGGGLYGLRGGYYGGQTFGGIGIVGVLLIVLVVWMVLGGGN